MSATWQSSASFSHLQILVLENVRFYKEETKNDPGYAEKVLTLSTSIDMMTKSTVILNKDMFVVLGT